MPRKGLSTVDSSKVKRTNIISRAGRGAGDAGIAGTEAGATAVIQPFDGMEATD
jgi:hypothetical protein